MKRAARRLALSGALLTPVPGALAADGALVTLSLTPSDVLHVWEESYSGLDGERVQVDLVLQGIAIHNRSDEVCRLSTLLIEAFRDSERVALQMLPRSVLEERAPFATRIEAAGLRGILGLSFGSEAVLDRPVPFAESPDIPPGSVLLLASTRIWLPVLPDLLRVGVECDGGRATLRASNTVAVRRYEARNEYQFPLEGRWLQIAAPSAVRNHHRYSFLTEFGVDLVKLGPEGSLREGAHADPKAFFGYGATVLAAADGEVVSVHRSAQTLAPRDGEAPEEFAARRMAVMREALDGDFLAFSAGNHIVIRHPGPEYSFYAHLSEHGVLVEAGQPVRRGQPIGRVGGTGETTYVHLHFQVWDRLPGPGARSLPFRFADVLELPFEPGYVVGAAEP